VYPTGPARAIRAEWFGLFLNVTALIAHRRRRVLRNTIRPVPSRRLAGTQGETPGGSRRKTKPRPGRPLSSIVRLIKVSRRYRRGEEVVIALDRLSFEVGEGEILALEGPSGCGKSTTLGLIAGVDRPNAGHVIVAGLDLTSAAEPELVALRRRTVGIVFQAFHLFPNLTVEENVALPLALDGRRDPARVASLVERIGLSRRRSHYPSELSGGEQQRTAVARALVHRPAVLLADEPTGNLDSHSGAAVLRLIDELRREEGAAVVLATHDGDVSALADRIVHLRDGTITTE
jgi:putative ABC transport system ATP-binding protein